MTDESICIHEFDKKKESGFAKGCSPFYFAALTFFTFFYIYEFNLSVWGGPTFITSRRISIAFFIIICFFQNRRSTYSPFRKAIGKTLVKYTIVLFAFFLYVCFVFVIIGIGDGESVLVDIIQLLLFGIVPAFLAPRVFRTKETFLKVLLATAIVQTVIILLCQFNSSFCGFIDVNFSTDYQYVSAHRSDYAGGLACITAPGLLRYSTGFFACLYFLFSTKKVRFFFLFLLLSFVGTMVARTGLVFFLMGLLFVILFSCFEGGSKLFIKLSVSVLTVFIASCIALNNAIVQSFIGENFKRLNNLFVNGIESEFLGGYLGNGGRNILPSLNASTFWGTGMTSGIAGNGEQCIADGGYIRLFFAFGLVGAIVFYLCTAIVLFSGVKRYRRTSPLYWSVLFFCIAVFVGEFKEYLIFTQYPLFIIFSIFIFDDWERANQK